MPRVDVPDLEVRRDVAIRLGRRRVQHASPLRLRLIQLLGLPVEHAKLQGLSKRVANAAKPLLLNLLASGFGALLRVRLRQQPLVKQASGTVRRLLQISVHDGPGRVGVAPLDERLAQPDDVPFFHGIGIDQQQSLHQIRFPTMIIPQLGRHIADRVGRFLPGLFLVDRREQLRGLGPNQLQVQRDDSRLVGLQPQDRLLRFRDEAFRNQGPNPQHTAPVVLAEAFFEGVHDVGHHVIRPGLHQRVAIVKKSIGPGVNDAGTHRGAQEIDDRPSLRRLLEDRRQRLGEERVPLLGRVGRLDLLDRRHTDSSPPCPSGPWPGPACPATSGPRGSRRCPGSVRSGERPLRRGPAGSLRRVRHRQREDPLDAAPGQHGTERKPVDPPGSLRGAGRILRIGQSERLFHQTDRRLQCRRRPCRSENFRY